MTPDTLKRWRARLNLTQEGASEALGVPVGTYKGWEGEDPRRQVRHSKLVALACAAVLKGLKPVK